MTREEEKILPVGRRVVARCKKLLECFQSWRLQRSTLRELERLYG